jgi:hypothetical protein
MSLEMYVRVFGEDTHTFMDITCMTAHAQCRDINNCLPADQEHQVSDQRLS